MGGAPGNPSRRTGLDGLLLPIPSEIVLSQPYGATMATGGVYHARLRYRFRKNLTAAANYLVVRTSIELATTTTLRTELRGRCTLRIPPPLLPDDDRQAYATFASSNGWTIHRNTLHFYQPHVDLRQWHAPHPRLQHQHTTDVPADPVGYDGVFFCAAEPVRLCSTNLWPAPHQAVPVSQTAARATMIHVAVDLRRHLPTHVLRMMDKLGTWTAEPTVDGNRTGGLVCQRLTLNRSHSLSALLCSRSCAHPNIDCGSIRLRLRCRRRRVDQRGFARPSDNGFPATARSIIGL